MKINKRYLAVLFVMVAFLAFGFGGMLSAEMTADEYNQAVTKLKQEVKDFAAVKLSSPDQDLSRQELALTDQARKLIDKAAVLVDLATIKGIMDQLVAIDPMIRYLDSQLWQQYDRALIFQGMAKEQNEIQESMKSGNAIIGHPGRR